MDKQLMKRGILALFLLLVSVRPVRAQILTPILAGSPSGGGGGDTIAFDNKSTQTSGVTGQPLQWNHVTNSNTPDGCLLLGNGIVDTISNPTLTGVKYNGVSGTVLGSKGYQNNNYVAAGIVLAPATGTNQAEDDQSGDANIFQIGGGYSLTGCKQSTTVDATGSASGTSGTQPSCPITTVASNAWVITFGIDNNADTLTPTAPAANGISTNGTVSRTFFGATRGPIASPGSITIDFTGGSGDWATFCVSIAPGP